MACVLRPMLDDSLAVMRWEPLEGIRQIFEGHCRAEVVTIVNAPFG